MKIEEKDFVMEDVASDSDKWDLAFYKRVKKRDTGEYSIELGDKIYGLSLSSCLRRIAKHRVAKKYEEENISLKEFLNDYQKSYREIIKLCRESIPEHFDTGD